MYLATTELSTNSLIGVIIIKPRCMWPCCVEEQTIPYIIQSTANNNRRKTCCRRSIHKVQNAINAVQTSDVLLWAESHLRGQRTTNSAISNSRHATRVAEHTVRHDTRVACLQLIQRTQLVIDRRRQQRTSQRRRQYDDDAKLIACLMCIEYRPCQQLTVYC